MARKAVLLVDIAANLARLQQDMGQAKGIVDSTMRDVSKSVNVAKSALSALGVTLSVGYFASMIRETVAFQAELGRLGTRAGTTVEVMSALGMVAKRSGTDMEAVTAGMQKLAKSMSEAGDGTSKAGKVFEALKVSTTDAGGALRSTHDVMREVGDKLMTMRDQTLAVAFAQAVFGKSGAQLLPFLYDLARAGELHAKVTTEQAKAAKEFEDRLRTLEGQSQSLKRALVNDMLPELIRVTDQFLAAKEAAGGFFGAWALFLSTGGEDRQNPEAALTKEYAALADLRNMRSNLNPDNPTNTGFDKFVLQTNEFIWGDVEDLDRQIAASEKRVAMLEGMVNRARTLQAKDPHSPYFDFSGGGIPLDIKNPLGIEPQAGNDATKQLERSIVQRTEILRAELASTTPLTEAQRELIRVSVDLARGYATVNDAKGESLQESLRELGSLDDQLRAREATKRVMQEAYDAERAYLEQQAQVIAQMDREIAQAREHNEEIGLTGEQLDRLRLKRQDEAIAAEQRARLAASGLEDNEAEIRQLDAKIDRLQKLRDISADSMVKQAAADANKRQREEFDRTAKHIEDTLSHALVEGFMHGGKSGGEILRRAIESALADAVFTPLIRPLVQPVAQFGASLSQSIFGGGAPGYAGGSFGGAGGGYLGAGAGALVGAGNGIFQSAGVYFGSQTLADIGNFGYGAPILGGLLTYAATGNAGAGIGTTLGGIAGSAFGPVGTMVGGAIGGAIGGSLFGDDGGVGSQRIGTFTDALGSAYYSPLRSGDDSNQASLNAAGARIAAQEQVLVQRLNLTATQMATVNQALGASYHDISWDGMSIPDWLAAGGERQLQAERLQTVANALGTSIENLTQTMSMSEEQWHAAQEAREQMLSGQLYAIQQALPGQLGITKLEQFQNSLAVSEMGGGPLDRLAAARMQYEATLGRARTGDLGAIGDFPGVAQQYLGIGRDVYASGGQFQDILAGVRGQMQDVLDQRLAVRDDILKDVPAILMQNKIDEIAALRDSTKAIVAELQDVRREIARWRAAT